MSDSWDAMGLGRHRSLTRECAPPSDPLGALLAVHDYAAMPAVLADRRTTPHVAALVAAGRALVELDLYGIAERVDLGLLPDDIARGIVEVSWPREPHAADRGPLIDLIPLLRHMIEVMEVLVTRADTTGALSSIHLAAEYLPWAAWQNAAGTAGEPAEMATVLADAHDAWHGDICPLDREDRAAFAAVGTARDSTAAWDDYVRDSHSRVAAALVVCGGVPSPASTDNSPRSCRRPCQVAADRDMGWPMTLIRRLRDSALLELRHDSPVGHFFAVPSEDEVSEAWHRTVRGLLADSNETPRGQNPFAGAEHGLRSLFATVAGRTEPLAASDLLERIAGHITAGVGGR